MGMNPKEEKTMADNRAAKTKSPFAPGVVKVKVLDVVTKEHHGEFMHMGLDKAREGEAKGLWKILPDQEGR
jgi:hypothetical protein